MSTRDFQQPYLGGAAQNANLGLLGNALGIGNLGNLTAQQQALAPIDPSAVEARIAEAIDGAQKRQQEKEWESFQRGIRMATEALVDMKERARAWDSYVVAAMRAGKTDAEAVGVADSLLQERDGRFSDPKN